MVKFDNKGDFRKSTVSKQRGDRGTFYIGKVLSYNPDTKRHDEVYYPYDKSTRRHNLFDKTRGDYIERGKYWRMKTT